MIFLATMSGYRNRSNATGSRYRQNSAIENFRILPYIINKNYRLLWMIISIFESGVK